MSWRAVKFYVKSRMRLSSRGLPTPAPEEHKKIVSLWKEDTPEEMDNTGAPTGRVAYNTIFSKTAQGGDKRLAETKWLIPNTDNPDLCPVRLFKKLLSKRTPQITTDRLLLTWNPQWQNGHFWYKNALVSRNELSKWTVEAASKIGVDTKKVKISNHSLRSSAVSHLAKAGVQEQELIKMTGHTSACSIKPYLQLDAEHHHSLIEKMRNQRENSKNLVQPSTLTSA